MNRAQEIINIVSADVWKECLNVDVNEETGMINASIDVVDYLECFEHRVQKYFITMLTQRRLSNLARKIARKKGKLKR